MPINLQGSGSIQGDWGRPPELQAPNISGLVHAILSNRLGQQKLTQESIADTIKNIQQQRESAAYTDALQKAGLLPEGDYGGLGIKGGSSLAAMLQRKQALDALAAHRSAMEARIGGRGRGRGSGGGGDGDGDGDVQVEAPEDYYGLSVAPGAPSKETTQVINGIVHVQDKHGGWKPGPKWMQQGTGQDGTAKPTEIAKAVKEQMGLMDYKSEAEKKIAEERAANIKAKLPNVPFSESDRYNTTINRLKQLQAIPGMPSTAPATPQGTPPPADTAAGHATDYGTTGSDDTSGVRVKVISPDGKVGTLPASQLQDALVMGYKQVP